MRLISIPVRMEPIVDAVRPLKEFGEVVELQPLSFDSFYRQSWNEIYRPLAATIRDLDLAAEAVDEAMLRAYSRWRRVSRMSNPTGWVYRVAYRWALDHLRRRAVERRVLPRLVSDSPSHPVSEPSLNGALAGLSDGQRAVVVLACAFDWTEREIADVLGIPQGTVKSRLHRGLAALREEMGV